MTRKDDKGIRDRSMSIVAHLEELRRRLWWVAVVALVGFALAIAFYHPIFKVLLVPAHGLLSPNTTPIVTSPTEFMGATITVAIVAGLVLALPFLVYQIILFVAPAVSAKNQALMLLAMPIILLLFAGGVAMGYFLVLPIMFRFLLTYGNGLVTPMIRISDYLNLLVILLAGIGLAFETPLVMYLLAKLRVISYKGFMRFQKWMIFLSFVVGAIFDPSPNPFDQIVVAGTIIALYQIGVLLAWLVRPRETSASRLAPSSASR